MISPESGLGEVKHASALINPVSTNSRRGARLLKRIEETAQFDIRRVYTSRDEKTTRSSINYALESEAESGILIVVSGDGVLNEVVNEAILGGLPDESRLTPLWVLKAGNASDGSRALHPKEHLRRPELVLKNGRYINVHPIRFDILKPQDNPRTQLALLYASFGMTALMASEKYLNNPRYREHLGRLAITRYPSEVVMAGLGLITAGINIVERDEKESRFFDMIFANSKIMGKHGRFPVALDEDLLFNTIVEDNKSKTIAWAIKKLLTGSMEGEYLDAGEHVTLSLLHDTYVQFNGQGTVIPGDSKVNVSIEQQDIRLVTSNPDPTDNSGI